MKHILYLYIYISIYLEYTSTTRSCALLFQVARHSWEGISLPATPVRLSNDRCVWLLSWVFSTLLGWTVYHVYQETILGEIHGMMVRISQCAWFTIMPNLSWQLLAGHCAAKHGGSRAKNNRSIFLQVLLSEESAAKVKARVLYLYPPRPLRRCSRLCRSTARSRQAAMWSCCECNSSSSFSWGPLVPLRN